MLLTVIALIVLASTASSISCYRGVNDNGYQEGPYKWDCGDERERCSHVRSYADDEYYERWDCGACPDRGTYPCEECDYHFCNYAGDKSGAGQLVVSTLSILVPAALLY